MPEQEKGTRSANALPYELYADGKLSDDKKTFMIRMQSANKIHGSGSAGAPFNVYAPARFRDEMIKAWSYAVKAGDTITDTWDIADFENGIYQLRLYGPNGFYREFRGSSKDPGVDITADIFKNTLRITVKNRSTDATQLTLTDNAYGSKAFSIDVAGLKTVSSYIDVTKSHGWYDLSLTRKGDEQFRQTFAGRVEEGKPGRTDPLMGKELSGSAF